MTKYHVEYNVEVQRSPIKQQDWSDVEHGVRYAEGVIPGAPSTRLISVPATATITEIKDPVKVGDVLETVEDVNRAFAGTVAVFHRNAPARLPDAFLKGVDSDIWWRDGISSGFTSDDVSLPLTVVYVPETVHE